MKTKTAVNKIFCFVGAVDRALIARDLVTFKCLRVRDPNAIENISKKYFR